MHLDDLYRISLRQVLRRSKKLTAIIGAIALGAAGLIFVLTMGDEVKGRVNDDLVQMSQATIVRCIYDSATAAQDLLRRPPWFKNETVAELLQNEDIDFVSRSTDITVTSYVNERAAQFVVRGCDADYWNIYNYLEVQGRYFTREEDQRADRVCVLGEQLAIMLFGTADVVGQDLPIQNDLFRIVGVLVDRTAEHRTDWAFVPLNSALQRFSEVPRPDIMYVMCSNWEVVMRTEQVIRDTILKYQEESGLLITVAWGPLRSAQRIMLFVELFIYFSLGVMLLLGVFGIFNTMTTQVKARTREIGLKKAIGATDMDILKQFLLEAVYICMAGAFLGVLLGTGAVLLSSTLMGTGFPMDELLSFSGISLALSAFTGIGAGWLPARTASRMDVVIALRYE